jgi:hypothetical protein|tara:strand:- start:1542 stop:1796 length:255 start_codon:yes stop_codon:yes gene_type:complete
MSFVYKWQVSNGDEVLVEYCWSTKDDCIKVVEMSVNGKFHRINWMSSEGRDELMSLLEEDYHNRTGVTMSSIQVRESMLFNNWN